MNYNNRPPSLEVSDPGHNNTYTTPVMPPMETGLPHPDGHKDRSSPPASPNQSEMLAGQVAPAGLEPPPIAGHGHPVSPRSDTGGSLACGGSVDELGSSTSVAPGLACSIEFSAPLPQIHDEAAEADDQLCRWCHTYCADRCQGSGHVQGGTELASDEDPIPDPGRMRVEDGIDSEEDDMG